MPWYVNINVYFQRHRGVKTMCEYYRNRAGSGAAHHRNDSLEALFAEDGDELCAVV